MTRLSITLQSSPAESLLFAIDMNIDTNTYTITDKMLIQCWIQIWIMFATVGNDDLGGTESLLFDMIKTSKREVGENVSVSD